MEQNSKWIPGSGVLNAKVRKVEKIRKAKVVVSMTQTLWARIGKHGIDYIGQFDNIISDEVHVDIFMKVVNEYDFKTLIGFTATPLYNKKETIEHYDDLLGENVKYQRRMTMSRDYDVLIEGVTEQDLIDKGFLTQDKNVVLKMPGMDRLVRSNSSPDGYTSESLTDVFGNRASMEVLWDAYLKYGKGKKTMIFNATSKVNKLVHAYFQDMETNCVMFDSVNKSEKSRSEVIDWFNKERDAVLINCNVFTTGFDVTDVETIILNRSTKSLSLFLQMVGRGSRITEKIYKPHFTVIDLGANIAEHGVWSLKRSWQDYFLPKKWKRKENIDVLKMWKCKACDCFNMPGEVMREDGRLECAFCGTIRKQRKEKSPKTGELVMIDKPKPPSAKSIIDYVKMIGGNATTAFKILDQQIVDLFVQHEVTLEEYEARKMRWRVRIAEIYRPVYFAIIRDDELD
jgi:superfamily II DNA or RNA helicase